MSTIQGDWLTGIDDKSSTSKMYDYGVTTLISDKSRVYKGGSWADRAYFMSPGVRRFLNEDEASSSIGFRCAMNKVGSPLGSKK
jgi:formylglycine-generating enzyme required for sulfatase activity